MSLSLRQSAKPKPGMKDYWEWAVWLDGPDEEIAEVESVDYRLHPTFPRPHRTSTSAQTRFRITSYGWGEFLLFSTVHFKDGRSETLEHWIHLRGSGDGGTSSAKSPSRIYLTYTAGDTGPAQEARASLMAQGIEVLTSDDLASGVPWQVALSEMIGSADAVVVLAPEHESQAIAIDMQIARDLKITMLPVVLGGRSSHLPAEFQTLQQIQLKDAAELGPAITAAGLKEA